MILIGYVLVLIGWMCFFMGINNEFNTKLTVPKDKYIEIMDCKYKNFDGTTETISYLILVNKKEKYKITIDQYLPYTIKKEVK